MTLTLHLDRHALSRLLMATATGQVHLPKQSNTASDLLLPRQS